ncbi:thioredoxin [Pseudarcicella hirudinis]|uniref:Thioredoxin n=1 Tax=Pseudarcicella hirudinis TaxID=1079859 RepID=A0A1I5XPL3_9BACT|nr:thioredoxin family protein [Pseudarcicella hirudinis]SFQ33901.1 thioredoxin [Pseudarcicella hirudinis]
MTISDNFQELIESETPVLIDFFTTWCKPCRAVGPILDEIKDIFDEEIRIIKIDLDRVPALKKHLKITEVPTLMLFQNGKQLWRQSGVVPSYKIQQVVKGALY